MRWIALTITLAALLTAPLAAAQGGTTELTIVAPQSSDCSDGKTYCFEVTEGSLSDISPGDEVTVTFKNEGQTVHNLYVTQSSNADPNNEDTSGDAAIASTEDLDQGEEATITFTAPEDGTYFWCDVTGHEQMGMWLETSSAGTSDDSAETSTSDGGQNSSPGVGVGALAIVGLAAALLYRRDRR